MAAALAIVATVRERSLAWVVVPLAIGAGALLGRAPRPHGSRRPLALLVATALLAPPVALAARLGPAEASAALTLSPALAWATPMASDAAGYVLHASEDSLLGGAELVRIRRHRIGSWAAESVILLPDACRRPERIDGIDPSPHLVASFRTDTGVMMSAADLDRACWVPSEGVVAGFAPRGTSAIEAVTIAGGEVAVPLGRNRAYVLLLERGTIAETFVRITFRDARGAMLDSKPVSLGEYANLGYASSLIERPEPGTTPLSRATVAKYILTPSEFDRICDLRPPHGDGFLTIAIVRRDDGETREVVVGTGMPFSAGHPRPDPPLVLRSGGTPCFAP